jgi:hypothetical protein
MYVDTFLAHLFITSDPDPRPPGAKPEVLDVSADHPVLRVRHPVAVRRIVPTTLRKKSGFLWALHGPYKVGTCYNVLSLLHLYTLAHQRKTINVIKGEKKKAFL